MDIDNYQKQNPPKHPTTGKLELMLRQSPTRGLSHSKSRQEPPIDGTTGTVGPLVPSTEGATIKS